MGANNFKKGKGTESTPKLVTDGGVGTDQVTAPVVTMDEGDVTTTQEVKTTPQPSEEMGEGEYTEDRVKEYYEFLKDKGIEDSDLMSVLDTLVTSGTVKWEFKLFEKVPVTLVMRPAWVNAFILRQIEELAPKTFSRFTDIVSVYNLAGSLSKYGTTTYQANNEEDIIKNYDAINSLGFIIQNKLVSQLAIFDRILAVATSDWAIENFTQPQSEN